MQSGTGNIDDRNLGAEEVRDRRSIDDRNTISTAQGSSGSENEIRKPPTAGNSDFVPSGSGVHGSDPAYDKTLIVGPEVGYTDLLDYEIQEKQKEKRDKRNPLRPSSAGSCARRLSYELAEYRGLREFDHEKRSPATWRLLELGHSVEFSALRNFQLLKVVEQRYKQQVLTFFEIPRIDTALQREVVEGSCDVVLWSKRYRCVADIKSKGDKFSHAFKTKWDEDTERFSQSKSLIRLSETAFFAPDLIKFIDELGDDFLADNFYQLNLYACSDFMRDRGVDHAFIYQYNKNDSRHREIRFKPDQRAFDRVRRKFEHVARAVDEGHPENVERSFALGSIRCGLCAYKHECWGNETDPSRAYFRTLPPKHWPTDLEARDPLSGQLSQLEAFRATADKATRLEQDIVKEFVARELQKIRLPNGHIYQLKFLKSPREHFEIRRTKL